VKAACEVSFEAAQCFLGGLAFGVFASDVRARLRVIAGAGDRNDVQRVVELAVTAAVEPLAVALS
jgi:hypothetical protein